VMLMYMKEPKEVVQLNTSPGLGLALAVTVAAVILIGILPGKVLALAQFAVASF